MQVPNCLFPSDRMNREVTNRDVTNREVTKRQVTNREVTYRRIPSQKPKEYNLSMLCKNFWLTWQFLTNDDFIFSPKFYLTLIQFEFNSIQILHSISPKFFLVCLRGDFFFREVTLEKNKTKQNTGLETEVLIVILVCHLGNYLIPS